MTQSTIIVFSLIIVAVLILFSFYDKNNWSYYRMGGYVFLLITGITILTSPIAFLDQTQTTYNYTTYNNTPVISTQTETMIYSNTDNTLNYVLGIVLVLASLTGITNTAILISDEKQSVFDM